VNGRPLRVVGVADSIAKAKFLVIWVRRETAMSLASDRDEAMVVRQTGKPSPQSLNVLATSVERWIVANRPSWREATTLSVKGASDLEMMRRRVRLIRLSLTAFCLLTVFVASIGITNVIFASVLERVREVGIRKAVGARFSDVFAQFLAESLAITALGAIIGIAIGVGLGSAFAWFVRWDTGQPLYLELRGSTVAITSGLAITAGILAGVAPSLRAARMPPIEAMRTE
jgi:putative ABC transport system permease protein